METTVKNTRRGRIPKELKASATILETKSKKEYLMMPTSTIADAFMNGSFDFMYEIELNRKISTRHVHKLKDDILKMYKLIGDKAIAPIYIVQKSLANGNTMSYILDGQHRVKASMTILSDYSIDININMVVLDGDELTNQKLVEIISTFNSSSVKWNNLTYIQLFAKLNTKGYAKFLRLMQSKERKYYATNLAHLYTGSRDGLQKIKSGEKLDVYHGNIRKEQFDDIINELPPNVLKAKLLRAVTTILLDPAYNHEKFLPKFKKYVKRALVTDRFPTEESDLYNAMSELLGKPNNTQSSNGDAEKSEAPDNDENVEK